jgi:hypothetical protein
VLGETLGMEQDERVPVDPAPVHFAS